MNGKIICRIRGKHTFRLKRRRYRCVFCGELRMMVVRKLLEK